MSRKLTTTMVVISALMVLAQGVWAKTIYVDAGAAGANNGTSWANAYVYLQDALTDAAANDEIRVATGVYTPDLGAGYTPGDREASFVLKNLVRILGGFPHGGGTLEERDWELYETILSGDLNGDDDPDTLVQNLLTDPTRADNSYNVIYSNLCGPPTLLDGLIVTAGQANGAGALGYGGGWYSITNSSPTLINCSFTRNAAQTRGGAWYNEGANCRPTLTNVTFTQNYTGDRGGAAAMLNTGADVKLDGCNFSQNRAATHGGSIYLDRSSPTISDSSFSNDYAANGGSLAGIDTSAPTISNTSFTSSSATNGSAVWADSCQAKFYDSVFNFNTATASGGACYFSGGQAVLDNCSFENNHAANGGAVYHTSCNVVFEECDFVENVSTGAGGAIYSYASSPQINRCLFYSNSASSDGGAICNHYNNMKVTSSKFIGNYSVSNGGAIASWGACNNGHAYLTGWNCVFVGNYVTGSNANGGAVANIANYCGNTSRSARIYTTFINSTFYANVAVRAGGGIYSNDNILCTNTVRNSILWGNADTAGGNYSETAQIINGNNTVGYSCIQGLTAYAGNGNIGDAPLFVDPLGEDWIPGTLDDNLRLLAGSPCIDAGDNSLVPVELTEDLDGNPRILDGNNDGTATVDMGAYEFNLPECIPYFEDPALKEAVEAALGIADPNCVEMLELTSLTALSKNIVSLVGLEYATNMTSLNLKSNKIEDISPLANLPLKYLYLGSNLLGSGDWQDTIATLPQLVTLYLHMNGLTSIPGFCEQTNLQNLYLYNNQITDLCPLADCQTTLRSLRVQNNPATTVEWCGTCVADIRIMNPLLTDFQYDSCCTTKLAADFNQDCTVNLLDFAVFASEWLRCTSIFPELCP